MLQPFQQRVVDEQSALDDKILKLTEFIVGATMFEKLPADEQDRLRKQKDLMAQYSEVLGERIAAFK